MRMPRLRGRLATHLAETAERSLTSDWFDDLLLQRIAAQYASHPSTDLSYATVGDYVDSFEHLNPMASTQGDLKDVQRPWVLKMILANVARGASLIEIGSGQPYVADVLTRLGYKVWVVDPYDGSGNGPVEYDYYRQACPAVNFVRARFDDAVADLPDRPFNCAFSISVLEHLDKHGLGGIFRGMARFLEPDGVSIHAIDHVHRGRGSAEHLQRLRFIVERLGLSVRRLEHLLAQIDSDTETYFLSAESHNRWRGALPYEDFPMRVCVSIQTVSHVGGMAQDGRAR